MYVLSRVFVEVQTKSLKDKVVESLVWEMISSVQRTLGQSVDIRGRRERVWCCEDDCYCLTSTS